jgi:predicted DNA binding CopG/RHH family protein
MKRLNVPKFATEAEEAKWWDEHGDAVGQNLMEAIKTGAAHRGGPRRVLEERRESKNITIRMPVSDIERARVLAERKGLGYQTYVKMLLHEALEREETRAGRRAG